MDKLIITADEARFSTREAIEENINDTLEALNGRIKNAIRNGNYHIVTDLGLTNDVVIRLLQNGYLVTNESNMCHGCRFRISWEENNGSVSSGDEDNDEDANDGPVICMGPGDKELCYSCTYTCPYR